MPAWLAGIIASAAAKETLLGYCCLWLWPIMVIGLYCSVYFENRHLAPLVIGGVLALLWLSPAATRIGVALLLLEAGVLALGGVWAFHSVFTPRVQSLIVESRWSYDQALVDYLRNAGFPQRGYVARVGWVDESLFLAPLDAQTVSWWRKPSLAESNRAAWAGTLVAWRALDVRAIIEKCRSRSGEVDEND
jgi:hypothetical protein